MRGTRFNFEVRPLLPERLQRLEELADDLAYSWSWKTLELFRALDRVLWEECGHDPKAFLRRVRQGTLDEAAADPEYLASFDGALAAHDEYRSVGPSSSIVSLLDPERDLVAYFCMEYGFFESLRLYSGGLGVLAGDHCKAASDLGLPFVAVGLLYHEGYFTQKIDADGTQIATFRDADFSEVPVRPALDAEGDQIEVRVRMPDREVRLKVWRLVAGKIDVYLLDSDVEANSDADRRITQRLYGGDTEMRIQQEIALGVGGVRALERAGLAPTAWHINEGHSAFQILERCRTRVLRGVEFEIALEQVAAGTLFTTHTPVAAGHDIFPFSLLDRYFANFLRETGVGRDRFLRLGATPHRPGEFSMTALALRGSRFHNGVSALHGRVASRMERELWPTVPAEENPIGSVTNGVHVATFLAPEWAELFDEVLGADWRGELCVPGFWERVEEIPEDVVWETRRAIKRRTLASLRERAAVRHTRNGSPPTEVERLTRWIDPERPDVLTIGFARRFTRYKRSTLVMSDLDRLQRIVSHPDRPVVLVFAGKAHPRDGSGQALLRRVDEIARMPEFEGHIVLLEGYDMAIARDLVAGCDVWLNNPEYPLEASGTSGQKAALNGALNLSVLDGWWPEACDGENGWAITPRTEIEDRAERDVLEAEELLDILEHGVVPLYYDREQGECPVRWARRSRHAIASILPRFNSERMVLEYTERFYGPAGDHGRQLATEDFAGAREIVTWKRRVRADWPRIALRLLDEAPRKLHAGEPLRVRVAVTLVDLTPDDVAVECLILPEDGTPRSEADHVAIRMRATGTTDMGEAVFELEHRPSGSGRQAFQVRVYPFHDLLAHPFEVGCMTWL